MTFCALNDNLRQIPDVRPGLESKVDIETDRNGGSALARSLAALTMPEPWIP